MEVSSSSLNIGGFTRAENWTVIIKQNPETGEAYETFGDIVDVQQKPDDVKTANPPEIVPIDFTRIIRQDPETGLIYETMGDVDESPVADQHLPSPEENAIPALPSPALEFQGDRTGVNLEEEAMKFQDTPPVVDIEETEQEEIDAKPEEALPDESKATQKESYNISENIVLRRSALQAYHAAKFGYDYNARMLLDSMGG